MKLLFFTPSNIHDLTSGGNKGSYSRYELLKQLADVKLFQLLKKSNFASAISLIQNKYPPLRNSVIRDVINIINNDKFDVVYVDTSCCGTLISKIKNKFPKIPVIAHFQNCEYDYNSVRFCKKNSLKSKIYLNLVQREERLTLLYSDYSISLSARDAQRIKKIYGYTTDITIPLFVKDSFKNDGIAKKNNIGYCLLFGPDFYANVSGFRWFVKLVSPKISIKTIIAGKGMEKYKSEFENYSKNVEVIGFVKDLSTLYQNAKCVCLPLLVGGGMKIKTIEALMYGKTIFGTDEAFSGFNFDMNNVAINCNDAESYIEQINTYCRENTELFNTKARKIYEQLYSDKVALEAYYSMLSVIQHKIESIHNPK